MTDQNDPIKFYEGSWYMFSNFSSFSIQFDGNYYPTVEHAYQKAKFGKGLTNRPSDDVARLIQGAPSAHQAKRIARAFPHLIREDWEETKLGVMEELLLFKLDQHEVVREKLLLSGDREIIEDSPSDSFWGRGPDNNGENHLGKLWMKIREELQKEA